MRSYTFPIAETEAPLTTLQQLQFKGGTPYIIVFFVAIAVQLAVPLALPLRWLVAVTWVRRL